MMLDDSRSVWLKLLKGVGLECNPRLKSTLDGVFEREGSDESLLAFASGAECFICYGRLRCDPTLVAQALVVNPPDDSCLM